MTERIAVYLQVSLFYALMLLKKMYFYSLYGVYVRESEKRVLRTGRVRSANDALNEQGDPARKRRAKVIKRRENG